MLTPAPIFKGATRPPCILGVPLKPFIGVVGGTMLVALWTYVPLVLAVVPAVLVMRAVTAEDDQRFRQLFLHFRYRVAPEGALAARGLAVFRAVPRRGVENAEVGL